MSLTSKSDFWRKIKLPPDEKSHGLGTRRENHEQKLLKFRRFWDQWYGRAGLCYILPPFGHLFVFQWLGVNRSREPPVPRGHRLSCCSTFSIVLRKGMASYTLHRKNRRTCFFCQSRYRVTRATASTGSKPVANKGGTLLPYVALVLG